jgi:N-methylhydantoinase A
LDLPALEKLADEINAVGVESVAIFFMNSYINPAHEEAACAILKKLLPDVYVTYSTDLTREWYEYERCSTVAANAYVGPQVSTYIRRLDSDLKNQGFPGTLFMMGSNGGLLSAERTCRQPIGLVESGPIGGCIGAGAYAEKLGFKNVVAFDMGGTTAKCALVENGRYSVNSLYYANGYAKAFRSSRRLSTSSKSAPAAVPSPGSTRRSACTSDRKAPVRRRARFVTAGAAPSLR